ncbi:hypothetical protein F3H65_15305 [Klebsiella quasipneumoniae]|nr:hypothetical protein [Klebsiella quasipneumoniae]MBW5988606.1 hypothetical protein [Klebsiella quasipneumoniae]
MASHSVKPKFSRYTQFQPDFIVIGVSRARCHSLRLRHLNPPYFKLHVCWFSSLTPVTYLSKLLGIRCVAAFLQLELFRVYAFIVITVLR